MESSGPAIQILPSLLAADMGCLAEECRRAEASSADALHLDIMDGHFVPNLSMGPDIVRMARKSVGIPLSVHLMETHPESLLDAFLAAGSDMILVHVESYGDIAAMITRIRSGGRRAGIVLNPETPAAAATEWLPLVDEVLLMTVHPGFGGQSFLPHVLAKTAEIRRRAPGIDISVDGGITLDTAPRCAAHGANALIAGTSLYRSDDMARDLARMRDACRDAWMTECRP